VAEACRYLGSSYHRTMPGRSGSPRSKPRGTKCPKQLQQRPDEVQHLLKEAIRAGHCGVLTAGFHAASGGGLADPFSRPGKEFPIPVHTMGTL